MGDLVKAGKVRNIGICNETPWGMMRYLDLADRLGLPRIMSHQYRYNLLARTYEIGHAEVSMRERCSLLAYSPLAHGTLTGKYIGGDTPLGSRLQSYPFFQRYRSDRAFEAAEAYVHLAREYEIDPAQMAIAFTLTQPWVAATLVAVSSMAQLKNNAASVDVSLPHKLVEDIESYHKANPNPAP
jgi:aryl-alcohol dehydrogenase-like predicted oxidoreductase